LAGVWVFSPFGNSYFKISLFFMGFKLLRKKEEGGGGLLPNFANVDASPRLPRPTIFGDHFCGQGWENLHFLCIKMPKNPTILGGASLYAST